MTNKVEPCLRKEVCQPVPVDEAEWRCEGCNSEIWFMRAVEPYERPPGAAEESRRLAEAMIDPNPESVEDTCPTCGKPIERWWFQCLDCRMKKKEAEHAEAERSGNVVS